MRVRLLHDDQLSDLDHGEGDGDPRRHTVSPGGFGAVLLLLLVPCFPGRTRGILVDARGHDLGVRHQVYGCYGDRAGGDRDVLGQHLILCGVERGTVWTRYQIGSALLINED